MTPTSGGLADLAQPSRAGTSLDHPARMRVGGKPQLDTRCRHGDLLRDAYDALQREQRQRTQVGVGLWSSWTVTPVLLPSSTNRLARPRARPMAG